MGIAMARRLGLGVLVHASFFFMFKSRYTHDNLSSLFFCLCVCISLFTFDICVAISFSENISNFLANQAPL